MREISRILYNRGIHRMFGSPTLGTVSGFLTVIFLLRAGVNLYFVYYIGQGSAVIDLPQISGGWFACVGGYLAACSSLSAFHISFALPRPAFPDFSPGGSRFRTLFLRRASILRPMNLAVLILSITGCFIFLQAGSGFLIIINGLLLLAASAFGGWLVFKCAEKVSSAQMDVQIVEVLILFVLVMLNPDVGAKDGGVSLLINGRLYTFGSLLRAAALPFCVLAVTISLLLLIRAVSGLSVLFHRRVRFQPIEGWYWRYFRPKFWILLYLIIFPLLFLPALSQSLKIQAAVVFVFITAFTYFLFLSHCENSVREKLHTSILSKENGRHILPSLGVHIFLTALPLSAFLCCK